jgi:phosphoglycolate phosphatase-like HAD superfamily hydrolase
MSVRGVIFDIDGTLVDTNWAHVEAWRRAFQSLGHEVPAQRIEREIGKGGDKLVPAVLGLQGEQSEGEALRKAHKEEFLRIAGRERFRIFPRVPEIFGSLRARHIRTALATSSDDNHLKATLTSAGVDLTRLADAVVTKNEADASKPDPDVVVAAMEKLALLSSQCAMVGDTVYDGQACRTAGVVFLGILAGGTSAQELAEAGAVGVWRDIDHLLSELDPALELAAHATTTD